ncbi:MAG: glutamate racemase [Flavobacteriales bacterium Tduv]
MDPLASIGIFDSGVGGLTVAQAIKQRMPDERLIYFGDTKNMPYGEKSKELIETYTQRITRFLIDQRCKAIVIACNSASSNALQAINQEAPEGVKVFDLISPVVESLSPQENRKFGVIATRATTQSNVYCKAIKKRCPGLEVMQMETPLLAPMIEEGLQNDEIIRAAVRHYLSREELKGIEVLILACTHYSIIEKEIRDFYNNKIHLIDTPRIVADQIHKRLSKFGLLSKKLTERDLFYVSRLTKNFEHQAKIFFGEKLFLKARDLDP